MGEEEKAHSVALSTESNAEQQSPKNLVFHGHSSSAKTISFTVIVCKIIQ